MMTSWPVLSFSAAQITPRRMHARTHTRTHTCPSTLRSISRFMLLNALHQTHSSASPPSPQSCSPANNNVELDSADPSESGASANVEGMKRPKSPSDMRTSRVAPAITHCQSMQHKNDFKLSGHFSAPTKMTEDFFWSCASRCVTFSVSGEIYSRYIFLSQFKAFFLSSSWKWTMKIAVTHQLTAMDQGSKKNTRRILQPWLACENAKVY